MLRIGHGYDSHRLAPNRPLMLGGVHIPFELGLAGHSDADALLHAVIDALLGATALGDIGQWFPPNNDEFKDADSRRLLQRVLEDARMKPFRLCNLDATIIAERPKLQPYLPDMRRALAAAFQVELDKISVKAKTNEGLDDIGRGKGIAVHCVVLLEPR